MAMFFNRITRSGKNDIILSFHDSVIRTADMQILESSEWLNDNIIGFYFQYLEKVQYEEYVEELALVGPDITHCIKLSSQEELPLFVEPLALHRKLLIVFPINDCVAEESPGGSHWTLLFYLRSKNTFYHFDSMGRSNTEHAVAVMAKVLPYVKARTEPKFVEAETPQQDNNYDCGIYVLCHVEYLCRKHLAGEGTDIFSFCNKEIVAAKRAALRSLINSLRNK